MKEREKNPPRGGEELPYGMQEDGTFEEDSYTVMASTECTGLIPTPPANEAEADSYNEIYDIPYAKRRVNDHLQQIQKTPGNNGAEYDEPRR